MGYDQHSLGGWNVKTGLGSRQIQIRRFYLLRELLADGLLDLGHVDRQQAGHNANVNHVFDELAQLGFRTNLSDDLVVGNRIKNQVVTEFVQRQGLVIQHRRAGRQRHCVFGRGFRIHGDQEIDLFLAPDVAVFVGADRVPGRKSGNVRREHILAGNRHAHLKNTAEENCVGALRTGAVDCRDLNAHVVDDPLLSCAAG